MNLIRRFFLIFATTVICCQSLYTTPISTETSTPYYGPNWCPGKFNVSCVSYDCISNISCPDNSYCCAYGENERTCCNDQSVDTLVTSSDFDHTVTDAFQNHICQQSNGCSTPFCLSDNNCSANEKCCYPGPGMNLCCVPMNPTTTESTTWIP